MSVWHTVTGSVYLPKDSGFSTKTKAETCFSGEVFVEVAQWTTNKTGYVSQSVFITTDSLESKFYQEALSFVESFPKGSELEIEVSVRFVR